MEVQIPIVGQAYKHRSVDLSAQTCKNWYPEINPGADAVVSLQPFPGNAMFSEGEGEDGGSFVFLGVLYVVSGENLFSVDSSGARSLIGLIPGTGLISTASTDIEVSIVRSGNVYKFDGSSIELIQDGDFESPDYVTSINSQAIYNGLGQRFVVSEPDDLTNINGLNFAAKEARGDTLVRPYAFQENLLLFGQKSTETWWNSGTGSPPVDRFQGGLIEKGLLAPNSVSHNDNAVYFLGDDRIVYQLSGTVATPISTTPLTQEYSLYENIEEAIGFCFYWDGQPFYYLAFPNRKTWVYSEIARGWFELSRTGLGYAFGATSFIEAYGKSFFGINGSLYEIKGDVYTYGGDDILRERISGVVTPAIFGRQYEGRKIRLKSINVKIKTTATEGGRGSEPIIMFAISRDGRLWNERQIKGAPLGRYTSQFKVSQLGSYHEFYIRIRVSDPVYSSIHSATAIADLSIV